MLCAELIGPIPQTPQLGHLVSVAVKEDLSPSDASRQVAVSCDPSVARQRMQLPRSALDARLNRCATQAEGLVLLHQPQGQSAQVSADSGVWTADTCGIGRFNEGGSKVFVPLLVQLQHEIVCHFRRGQWRSRPGKFA